MKNKQNNNLSTLNHKEIFNGSKESKTIGATEANHSHENQTFTSVDLWNILKNTRTGFARRRVNTLSW